MNYKLHFSDGSEQNFVITKKNDLFISEIFTGRLSTKFKPNPVEFSFVSETIMETKLAKGKSVEIVLKQIEDIINELKKDSSVSFSIEKIS